MGENTKNNEETFLITGNWADRTKNLNLQNPQQINIEPNLDKNKGTKLENRLESKLIKTNEDICKFIME